MKIRNGFVSNSSSSSFICLNCGNEHSGMDLSISDAEMVECTNGHVFCKEHVEFDLDELNTDVKTDTEAKEELKRFAKDQNIDEPTSIINSKHFSIYKLEELQCGYDLPIEWCPYCQMKDISADDYLAYTLKNTTIEELMQKLRDEFGDYKTFKSKIK